MSDHLPTGKAKAGGRTEGIEERMARFEASTAELRDTKTELKDTSIGLADYLRQLGVPPRNPDNDPQTTYATSLIAAAESDIKQDRAKLAALVKSPFFRLNSSPTRTMPALTTLPQRNTRATSSTPGFPTAIQEVNITASRSIAGRSGLCPNMPIGLGPVPAEAATVLSDSEHTQISSGPDDSMHSAARTHKDTLDNELDTTKINAIFELVAFLSNYICESDNSPGE
jgi:hypothetical protein